jgi:hypothetical protein
VLRLDRRDVLVRFGNAKRDGRTPVRPELGDGLGIAVQSFVANRQLEEHLRIGRSAHRRFQLGRSLPDFPAWKRRCPSATEVFGSLARAGDPKARNATNGTTRKLGRGSKQSHQALDALTEPEGIG